MDGVKYVDVSMLSLDQKDYEFVLTFLMSFSLCHFNFDEQFLKWITCLRRVNCKYVCLYVSVCCTGMGEFKNFECFTE